MPSRRVILPPLIALSLAIAAWACDPSARSVPEGEPDAAVDALPPAPGCPYAPDPPGACEPSRAPAPACAVDIEGYDLVTQRTFDAQGRAVGLANGLWDHPHTSNFVIDGEGRERLQESLTRGCLEWSTASDPLAEGWLIRERDARTGEEVCTVRIGHGAGLLFEQRDPGCDCRDVRRVMDCERGLHGPSRCAEFNPDGSPGATHRFDYDDAGRRTGWHTDHDGDGVYELQRAWTFDAQGRWTGELIACAVCEPQRLVRASMVYASAPQRSTYRSDIGDDGWAEIVWRETFDADGRVVLAEHGDDAGMTLREETVYDDRGGFVRTRFERGRAVSWTSRVIDGRITTETRQSEGERASVITRVDAAGRLIERLRLDEGSETRRVHDLYARDDRGRVTSQRTRRRGADGLEETFTLRFTWRGACPVAPVDYDGELYF